MWILPKQLHTLASVPDTEALISDYNEQSEICGQSLLVRSKPSPARTWSQKWKRDSWTLLLSGRILKPSLGISFAERWTSSLEASLVSHLVPQESVTETKIPDTSSHTYWMALEDADLPLFSLKMLKESSLQSSQETIGEIQQEPLFCSMSLGNWNEWVTGRRQAYSLRLKSAHLTRGSGSSSWPTIAVMDTTGGPYKTEFVDGTFRSYHNHTSEDAAKYGARLRDAVTTPVNWPTITAGEHLDQGTNWETLARLDKGGRILRRIATISKQSNDANWATPEALNSTGYQISNGQKALRLGSQVTPGLAAPDNRSLVGSRQESWATPQASDHVEGARTGVESNQKCLGRDLNTLKTNGKLNPRWVETLMGLPVGWVMPSCVNPITPIAEPVVSVGAGNWMTPEALNSTGYQISNGKKILRLGSQVTSTPPVTIELTNFDCSETESCQQPQKSPSELFGEN